MAGWEADWEREWYIPVLWKYSSFASEGGCDFLFLYFVGGSTIREPLRCREFRLIVDVNIKNFVRASSCYLAIPNTGKGDKWHSGFFTLSNH
jgi:hypothetical protein